MAQGLPPRFSDLLFCMRGNLTIHRVKNSFHVQSQIANVHTHRYPPARKHTTPSYSLPPSVVMLETAWSSAAHGHNTPRQILRKHNPAQVVPPQTFIGTTTPGPAVARFPDRLHMQLLPDYPGFGELHRKFSELRLLARSGRAMLEMTSRKTRCTLRRKKLVSLASGL